MPSSHNETILELIQEATSVSLETVESVIKKPKDLIEDGCLVYQDALIHLKSATATLNSLQEEKRSPKAILMTERRIKKLEDICTHLLDVTIQHAKTTPAIRNALVYLAIERDDANLYERLSQSGLKPDAPIVTEERTLVPRNLLNPLKNNNLMGWYVHRDQAKASSVVSNPNSMSSIQKWKKLEDDLAKLQAEYLVAKIGIRKTQIDNDLSYIKARMAAMGAT